MALPRPSDAVLARIPRSALRPAWLGFAVLLAVIVWSSLDRLQATIQALRWEYQAAGPHTSPPAMKHAVPPVRP
jgi:hypothetical protein